jgi:hypothetical protein
MIPIMIIDIITMTARKAIPPKLENKGLLVISFAPIFSRASSLLKAFKEIMSCKAVIVVKAVAGKL